MAVVSPFGKVDFGGVLGPPGPHYPKTPALSKISPWKVLPTNVGAQKKPQKWKNTISAQNKIRKVQAIAMHCAMPKRSVRLASPALRAFRTSKSEFLVKSRV